MTLSEAHDRIAELLADGGDEACDAAEQLDRQVIDGAPGTRADALAVIARCACPIFGITATDDTGRHVAALMRAHAVLATA